MSSQKLHIQRSADLGWEKRFPLPGIANQLGISSRSKRQVQRIQHFEVKGMAKGRNFGAISTFEDSVLMLLVGVHWILKVFLPCSLIWDIWHGDGTCSLACRCLKVHRTAAYSSCFPPRASTQLSSSCLRKAIGQKAQKSQNFGLTFQKRGGVGVD